MACASNGSAGRQDRAGRCRPTSRARTRSANSGWVFRPVPVAVPPSGIWPRPRERCPRTRSRALAHLRGVAGELLAQRDRHGVHQVGAAGLDDVGELLGLGGERVGQLVERGQQLVDGRGRARPGARPTGTRRWSDWPMLTWSLAWTPSPARLAITSLAFMFDEVPEPVWNTSIGNWSSCSPAAISSAAAAMRSADGGVEQPQLGVDPRRGGLDPAQPVHDRRPGSARPTPGSSQPPCGSPRPKAPPSHASIVVSGQSVASNGAGILRTMSFPAKPAVVLLSGGLDSTTVLAIAQSEGYAVHALSFRYGQRHAARARGRRASRRSASGVERHVVLDIDLRAFGGSALTADIDVPKGRGRRAMATGSRSPTCRPATRSSCRSRSAWAEVLGADDIFIGVNALDYSGYPDCRPEYIEAFERDGEPGHQGRRRGRQRAARSTRR